MKSLSKKNTSGGLVGLATLEGLSFTFQIPTKTDKPNSCINQKSAAPILVSRNRTLGARLSSARPIHEAVQDNVEIDSLSPLHQLAHHCSHVVSGEAHVGDVVDHLQRQKVVQSNYSIHWHLTSVLLR